MESGALVCKIVAEGSLAERINGTPTGVGELADTEEAVGIDSEVMLREMVGEGSHDRIPIPIPAARHKQHVVNRVLPFNILRSVVGAKPQSPQKNR
jgi:hypothetical protein